MTIQKQMAMEKILTEICICIPLLLYQWKLNGRDKSRVLSMKKEPISRIWLVCFCSGSPHLWCHMISFWDCCHPTNITSRERHDCPYNCKVRLASSNFKFKKKSGIGWDEGRWVPSTNHGWWKCHSTGFQSLDECPLQIKDSHHRVAANPLFIITITTLAAL